MKNSVIKDLSNDELEERIAEERLKLNKMKLGHAVTPVENPVLIRHTRKNIARLLTERSARLNKA